MTKLQPDDTLIHKYTHRLLDLIQAQSFIGPRTYGFEYEFLPKTILTPQDVGRVTDFLPQCGFAREADRFQNAAGMGVAFEPGGQLEYYSPPLLAGDTGKVDQALLEIEETNRRIAEELGIVYLATDFIPGRGDAPLCLESERYRLLHERLAVSGTRGHEMMKGTAGIHLHVVMRHIDELVPMFAALCRISREPLFKMSAQRRNIWDNTDPCRCGVLYIVIDMELDPHHVVEELVRVGLSAIVLGENQPFWKVADNNFDRFMYHLTTIFTDVRLNIKGPTLELRTPDSRPLNEFRTIWDTFVDTIAAIELE